jgi:hypothetical protein
MLTKSRCYPDLPVTKMESPERPEKFRDSVLVQRANPGFLP